MGQGPPHTRRRSDHSINLVLFPDDSAASFDSLPLMQASSSLESSLPQDIPLSLAQVVAEWQKLLKRAGRRRRVLETVLAVGHPLRLTGHMLVIGFSPRRRFHQELLNMSEYRRCVEEELARTFQVRLSVVTALFPERSHASQQQTFGRTPA
jgi:hypothetical protein